MSSSQLNKVSIIGTGRVAKHMTAALFEAGIVIDQIYGRDACKSQALSNLFNARHIISLDELSTDADIFIICISDDAVEKIISQINIGDKLIVHTSGSLSIDVFKDLFDNYGVFYPLQTFSIEGRVDFNEIPICIEANSFSNEKQLSALAQRISNSIELINSDKRLVLHTAAVFACNFTNHFYVVAEDLLNEHGLDFNLIRPLIKETADKVMDKSPGKVQTGPALRRDQLSIDKHLDLLEYNAEYRELYRLMTEQIMKKYKS